MRIELDLEFIGLLVFVFIFLAACCIALAYPRLMKSCAAALVLGLFGLFFYLGGLR